MKLKKLFRVFSFFMAFVNLVNTGISALKVTSKIINLENINYYTLCITHHKLTITGLKMTLQIVIKKKLIIIIMGCEWRLCFRFLIACCLCKWCYYHLLLNISHKFTGRIQHKKTHCRCGAIQRQRRNRISVTDRLPAIGSCQVMCF